MQGSATCLSVKHKEIIHKSKNEGVILEQAIFLREAIRLQSGAYNEFNSESRRAPVGCQAVPENYQWYRSPLQALLKKTERKRERRGNLLSWTQWTHFSQNMIGLWLNKGSPQSILIVFFFLISHIKLLLRDFRWFWNILRFRQIPLNKLQNEQKLLLFV